MKPLLVWLPGWNLQAEVFKPFTYLLDNYFEHLLLTPPLIQENEIAYPKTVEYIISQLSAYPGRDIYLLGWSMGGQLAMLTAQQIKLKGLFILSSAVVFSRNEADKKSFRELCRTDFPRAVKYFHKLMGDLNVEDSIILKQNFIDDQISALAYLKNLHASDLTAVAQQITCPTWIFHAEDDQIIPFTQGQEIAKLIPNARLISFPGNDHFLFFRSYDKISHLFEDVAAGKIR